MNRKMAKASSDIGPIAAAAVSAAVSTIVTAATASASAATVRVASSTSAAPTSVAAVAAPPQVSPRKDSAAAAAAAGCDVESIGRGSEESVVDNAAAGLDSPRGNVRRGENAVGTDRNRKLEPLVSRGSKCLTKDEEEKGGQLRGAAQVVYSRGPEDGEAVWVAGRREAAAVKVRRPTPYPHVALLQASQLCTPCRCGTETPQARHTLARGRAIEPSPFVVTTCIELSCMYLGSTRTYDIQ